MIKKEFLEILCCPLRSCRGNLIVGDGENLKCVICGDAYSVVDGIPILYPNEKYSPDIHERHWDKDKHAKSYAKKYDGYMKKQGTPWGLYTHESELYAVKRLTKKFNYTDKVILDIGCGNGRLLSSYPEAKKHIGIDTSLTLLKSTREREPSFFLICAQAEDLPIKDAVADLSVSIRVFQHLKSPEDAFAEMARVTKPSGQVALEVYNKLNLKEVYKRFRMTKFIDRIWSWGLSYDRYYSYREIESWAKKNFVRTLDFAGAGWGIFFYIFEPLRFRFYAPKGVQRLVYSFCFAIEKLVGEMPFFSKTLEKIIFLGSVQGKAPKHVFSSRLFRFYKNRKYLKRAKVFTQSFESRSYAYAGSDEHHFKITLDWISKAQDATPDNGVSRGFSMIPSAKSNNNGWQPSYPETTGYIIPTMLAGSRFFKNDDYARRAYFMGEWLLSIMDKEGWVQGGNISTSPKPAVFDTAQVIRGFIALYEFFKDERFLSAAEKSAEWLLKHEHNGMWSEFIPDSVSQTATTYYIYAAVPVAALGKIIKRDDFIALGERVGEYSLKNQHDNGWFNGCDFNGRNDPLLHTIGYTIDGLYDMGIILNRNDFQERALQALNGVLSVMDDKGFIPGRFNSEWKGAVSWACLTGIAQIGVTAMKAHSVTGRESYRASALKAKEFLKSCQNNYEYGYGGGIGALWGSWPISGGYNSYEAINWAAKFFADLLSMFIAEKNKK